MLARLFLAFWLAASVFPCGAARAQTTATVTDLYDFGAAPDGYNLTGPLVQGSNGDFYGVTTSGGANNTGTVFQITPSGTLTTLYDFPATGGSSGLTRGSDGNFYGTAGGHLLVVSATGTVTTGFATDVSAPLVQDSAGNFYGLTAGSDPNSNSGSVFKVSPAGVVTTLHSFDYAADGFAPSSLILGNDGNLYGTTTGGGGNGSGFNGGTLFEVTPAGGFTVLHRFTDDSASLSPASLIQASDGNFYGTALYDLQYGQSTGILTSAGQSVFQFTPAGVYKDIHVFDGDGVTAGFAATATVIAGLDDNIYGTVAGTVFAITPAGVTTTIHGAKDGYGPFNLIQGSDGNFYGTTGTAVVQITPAGAQTTLRAFTRGAEGTVPNGIVLGIDGNFYGTTYKGGISTVNDSEGDGTVFQVTPDGVLTVVHAFTGAMDGYFPSARLVPDSNGVLHGVASYGLFSYVESSMDYVAFQITPAGAATAFQSFAPSTTYALPDRLILASDGNFYGTTQLGGANSAGSVFKQTPAGVKTTLYSFGSAASSADGAAPGTDLIAGQDNNLYGTTAAGGANSAGTAFRLTLTGVLTTFHNFDAYDPPLAFIQASDGQFYGTTSYGKLFQLTSAGVFTTLYNFTTFDALPRSLVQGSDGNLYGTTEYGGLFGFGTVFKAVLSTPTPALPVVTIVTAGDGWAVEGGQNGKVTIRRAGDLTSPLVVRYKVAGSAVVGKDYKPTTGVATIPAGAAQVKVKIKPINDQIHEGIRKAKVKIKPALDGSYLLGNSTVAVVKVIDND